ncbi:MAG: dUTP diphosphatase [Thermodesulfovibrio sp.]|nr:dUTP diphosphatase [Thermodesulfovibrio sp.]
MKSVTVLIKKLPHAEDLPFPQYATKFASGMDLFACINEPIELKTFQRTLVPTGISIKLPPGYEAQIRPRSELSLRGIIVLNSPVTADCKEEIKVLLINFGHEDFVIERGMKIAQLVITSVYRAILLKKNKF